MNVSEIPKPLMTNFRKGMVIPAHPLALDGSGRFDERRQRALTRYYIDAGAGGLAVGVHTTQFEIRDESVGLFEPVLEQAAATAEAWGHHAGRRIFMIAGLCGQTKQASAEARAARERGYHAGLLSLSALPKASDAKLIEHCAAVAEELPLVGFYLQPSVGGRVLSVDFWRAFFAIENVIGAKIAPFDRYRTIDVVRALCESGRQKEVTLYTGNDDHIVGDLLTEFTFRTSSGLKSARIAGGLLGQWAVWTQRAVEMLEAIHRLTAGGLDIPPQMLTRAEQITDANAAIFDVANSFAGCIVGIHEVLRRQGLLETTRTLNPKDKLSKAQSAEIDRVCHAYPHLVDDEFVAKNLDRWMAD